MHFIILGNFLCRLPFIPHEFNAVMIWGAIHAGLLIWAAAGSVDTDLSFLSFLELYGTEIPERRMPARRVVEAFDVVEHV